MPEQYRTIYVEVEWIDGKEEKLTLRDGTTLEGVIEYLGETRAEFAAIELWNQSIKCVRLDQLRSMRIRIEDRYR